MFSSVHIQGFRAFDAFAADDLSRVTLLLGKEQRRQNFADGGHRNLAGCSLASGSDPSFLVRSLLRRNDGFVPPSSSEGRPITVRPLFHAPLDAPQATFEIFGDDHEGTAVHKLALRCEIAPQVESESTLQQPQHDAAGLDLTPLAVLSIVLNRRQQGIIHIPISAEGVLRGPVPSLVSGVPTLTVPEAEPADDEDANALPLHRQNQELARMGLTIPYNTLQSYFAYATEALAPITTSVVSTVLGALTDDKDAECGLQRSSMSGRAAFPVPE
jgi:hypothetical protein